MLNWTKPIVFDDSDRALVERALSGRVAPLGFARSLFGGHEARINWGYLHRALLRGYKDGSIVSFKLSKYGDLSVNWFTQYVEPKPAPTPTITHVEPIQPSVIPAIPDDDKPLFTARHKKKRIFKLVEHFKDIVPLKILVLWKLKRDNDYIHSESARAQREREFTGCAGPGDWTTWNSKFKLFPSYFKGAVTKRTLEQIIADNRAERNTAHYMV